MRGVILEFSDLSGTGLISGEDNGRYTFSKEDVRSTTSIRAGQKVDFEPGEDSVARAIFILEESAPAPKPAVVHAQYDLPPDHASLSYGLNPFEFFWKCMKLYADGRGRATVAEYWSFTLVVYLLLFGVIFLAGMIIGVSAGATQTTSEGEVAGAILVILFGVFALALVIPSITVTIRRLHDIGATGWLYLIALIPYIGGIALFVMSLIPSQKYSNQYGPYYRDVLNGTADIKDVFG